MNTEFHFTNAKELLWRFIKSFLIGWLVLIFVAGVIALWICIGLGIDFLIHGSLPFVVLAGCIITMAATIFTFLENIIP
jgi:hypothetical protein